MDYNNQHMIYDAMGGWEEEEGGGGGEGGRGAAGAGESWGKRNKKGIRKWKGVRN